MSPVVTASIAFVVLIALFAAVWAWQLKSKNAGMIDPIWAFSLGAVASVLRSVQRRRSSIARTRRGRAAASGGHGSDWHLWRRNAGKPEDPRYHRFREQWGAAAHRNMFWFLEFQTVISMVLFARVCGARMAAGCAVAVLVRACRADLDRFSVRRSAGGPATRAFCRRSRESREGLPRRFVAVLAPSELFLRVSALGCLCRAVDWFAVDLADVDSARADGVAVDEAFRRADARSASGSIASRLRRVHA